MFQSAVCGAVMSIGFMIWLSLGAIQHPNTGDILPLSTVACPGENKTLDANVTVLSNNRSMQDARYSIIYSSWTFQIYKG